MRYILQINNYFYLKTADCANFKNKSVISKFIKPFINLNFANCKPRNNTCIVQSVININTNNSNL